jgi:hypothetical protein
MPKICLFEEGEGEVAKLVRNILRLPISTICALENLCTLPELVGAGISWILVMKFSGTGSLGR